MIADILFAIGTVGFVLSDLKQVWKLFKHPHYSTQAFSKTHFEFKLFSLGCVITGYALTNLPIALSVAILQLVLNIYILKRLYK